MGEQMLPYNGAAMERGRPRKKTVISIVVIKYPEESQRRRESQLRISIILHIDSHLRCVRLTEPTVSIVKQNIWTSRQHQLI